MSEDGKKYAANLAKLLKERQDAIALLDRALLLLDDCDCQGLKREIDRFLMLADRT